MPQWRKLHVKTIESFDVNEMPDDFHRLLWVMLPLALCRAGRGVYNPSWVKAKVMPLRDDVSMQQIETAMGWFAQRGMLIPYTVDGRDFFHVPTWEQYQGNTSKEADSIYPAPPPNCPETFSTSNSEPLQTYSRPTPDLLRSKSGTDSDADSDAEERRGEADSPSGAQKPAPEPGPEQVPRSVSGSEQDRIRGELEQHFRALTRLDPPPRKTKRQQSAAAVRWWNPLREIAELVEWREQDARDLLSAAFQRLDGEVTISAPQSLLETSRGIMAEVKRGAYRPPDEPDGYRSVREYFSQKEMAEMAHGD